MPSDDLTRILREWSYDPENPVRRVTDAQGVARIQVRLPLGIEQYELDGRPDGLRPEGRESWLDIYAEQIERLPEAERTLPNEACARLLDEGILYYYRYLLLFQIGDYDRVIRDTARNLRALDLIKRYAADDEDRVRMTQYHPYILRIHASALAMKAANEGRGEEACEVLEQALRDIAAMEDVPSPAFDFEKQRSRDLIRGLMEEIRAREAPSEEAFLRDRLKSAVAREDYERAARLRDLLEAMERSEDA